MNSWEDWVMEVSTVSTPFPFPALIRVNVAAKYRARADEKALRSHPADNGKTRLPGRQPAEHVDLAQGAALFPGLRYLMRKSPALDVRPLLRAGREPHAVIWARIDTLAPGDSCTVITPFLPSPLIELARSRDHDVQTSHRPDGAWETHITRTVR